MKTIDGSGFCPNVSLEDNEFKENKALNDQGKVKDEGTIIVTAQLNINIMVRIMEDDLNFKAVLYFQWDVIPRVFVLYG
jgi:hypothetical protein